MPGKKRITVRVPDSLYARLKSFMDDNPQYSQKTQTVLHLLEAGLERHMGG